jgi:hypothetical protein
MKELCHVMLVKGNTPVSHQYQSQASRFNLQSVFVPYSINNPYHSPKSSSIQPTILKVSAKLSVGQIASERFSHRDPVPHALVPSIPKSFFLSKFQCAENVDHVTVFPLPGYS